MALPFFDANVMIGQTIPPLAAPILDAGQLLAEMDRFGIRRSLLFAYSAGPESKDEMNRRTLAAVRQSERLAPCWVLTTSFVNVKQSFENEVERLLGSGARAARLLPDEGPAAGPLPLRTWLLEPLLAGLNAYRIPLLIPESQLNVAQPGAGAYDFVHELCRTYPRIPVIILEPRYNNASILMSLMRRHRSLYATMSLFGLYRQLENIAATVGAERLLFSTGLPHNDPSVPVGMLQYSSLAAKDAELIAGGNLSRLLGSAGKEGQ